MKKLGNHLLLSMTSLRICTIKLEKYFSHLKSASQAPGKSNTWIFLLWLALVIFLSYFHVVWRDEVRALSFALQGESLVAMFEGLRGDAHPALWNLFLRAVHGLIPFPVSLKISGLVIAAIAVSNFLSKSPFPLWVKLAVVFGSIVSFEFSVMARNYGISMLFMFLFATFYNTKKEQGYWLGAILFLLANTNAHSSILVAIILCFWFIELVIQKHSVSNAISKNFIFNTLIAVSGILVCFFTIYPTFNDAAVLASPSGNFGIRLVYSLLLPADSFSKLMATDNIVSILSGTTFTRETTKFIICVIASIILFGSTLTLVRYPNAMFCALGALVTLSVFFTFVYPGGYRHQAIWFIFLLIMNWISLAERRKVESFFYLPRTTRFLSKIGLVSFAAILLLQIPSTVREVFRALGYKSPQSQSEVLSKLIKSRPELAKATFIAEPDYFVESIPYYLTNPSYLLREERFGNITHFTKNARLNITLDDILNSSMKISAQTNQPVVILLAHKIKLIKEDYKISESYNWTFSTNAEQVAKFRNSTDLIGNAIPTNSDETYDVYVFPKNQKNIN